MDVEALTKRLRTEGEFLGRQPELGEAFLRGTAIFDAADALTALSADLSHWEARAKELERINADHCRTVNSYIRDNSRQEDARKAAEARAKELERERNELRQSNVVLGQAVKEEYDRAKVMFEARITELERVNENLRNALTIGDRRAARAALEGKDNG